MSASLCACRFCGQDKTPQGIRSHEQYCEDNPHPGVPYEFQEERGLLDEDAEKEGAGPEPSSNPDQSAESGSGRLPDRSTLPAGKSEGEGGSPDPSRTDGGNPGECPLCGGTDVLAADDALREYLDAVDSPNPKAVLGYKLADHACADPDCAALWGEEYVEPLPMEAVVNA